MGREAACIYCNAPFIITEDHLRRKKIHCLTCTFKGKPLVTEEQTKTRRTADIFENLLKSGGL